MIEKKLKLFSPNKSRYAEIDIIFVSSIFKFNLRFSILEIHTKSLTKALFEGGGGFTIKELRRSFANSMNAKRVRFGERP